MSKAFQKLLKDANDFDLSNGVFMLLADHFGGITTGMPPEGKVIIWVWHTSGIIGNGGFQYLFENVLPDDLYFAGTLEAYRTLGADQCAEALAEALSRFPKSKPPKSVERRLSIFQQEGWGHLDRKFWDQNKQLPGLIANFIREKKDIIKAALAQPKVES